MTYEMMESARNLINLKDMHRTKTSLTFEKYFLSPLVIPFLNILSNY